MRLAVLISGRGSNLRSILESERTGSLGKAIVSLIISDKRDAKGLKYSKEYNKKTIIIESNSHNSKEEYDNQLVKVLHEHDIDLIVLAGFMRILTPFFVNTFNNRIVNIHPSLLPAFPGLNAQKQALNHGSKISGCTVHFASEEVDDGPIILQRAVEISNDDTEESLSQKILKQEHEILPLALKLISEGKISIKERKIIVEE